MSNAPHYDNANLGPFSLAPIKETQVPDFHKQTLPHQRQAVYIQEMRQLLRSTCDNKENVFNQNVGGQSRSPILDGNVTRSNFYKNVPNPRRGPLSFSSIQDALKPFPAHPSLPSARGSFLKPLPEPTSRTNNPRRPLASPIDAPPRSPIRKAELSPPPKPLDPPLGSLQQYVPSILSHYKANASKNKVCPLSIADEWRTGTTQKIKLFETIFNFCTYFNMRTRTFFTANNIFDRYVNHPSTHRTENTTLAALTSFFLAAKFEEIYPPSINEICKILNNRFSSEVIFQMESKILSVLDFNFLYVCPLDAMELIATQLDAGCPDITKMASLILSMFCFDESIDSHNVFKLAVFALSVSQRVVKDQFLLRAENVVSSEENYQFLKALRRIFDQFDTNGVSCFETRHRDQITRLRGFVFDKIPN